MHYNPYMPQQICLNNTRNAQLVSWARKQLDIDFDVEPVTGDASNRRYFRLSTGQKSWIVMDAPPELEDCRPFVDVTRRLRSAKLHAPEIIAEDLQSGFLLLEDLGDGLYRDVVSQQQASQQYQPIFDVLSKFATSVDVTGLPDYDQARLQQELDLFSEWYAPSHCQLPLAQSEQLQWGVICQQLITMALVQPQVFVHRDFHSCNVLQTTHNNPGIIDYQDAVRGPITYDLISWVLDRYISWPRPQVLEWYEQQRLQLQLAISSEHWLRWCDWMGLQRNLKVLGIFARLAYRDGKTSYIGLMPRFYAYVMETAALYPETQALTNMLEQRPCEQ